MFFITPIINKHTAGGVFDVYAPKVNAVKKPGEWNRMTITAKGNKVQEVGEISRELKLLAKELDVQTTLDVFTGTTRVAQALRQNGIKVITSDLAEASRVYSNALIRQHDNSHLQKYIDEMNNLEGYKGWITQNYSGGENWELPKDDGRYIYPLNAMKADAARDYVETLNLNLIDKDTLICSIMFALNKVNTLYVCRQMIWTHPKRRYWFTYFLSGYIPPYSLES